MVQVIVVSDQATTCVLNHKKAARPSNAAPATPKPVCKGTAAFEVEDPVREAAEAVAEPTAEEARDDTDPAWLVTALRAEAASLVMLPRMLLALEVNEDRLDAAPVFPVAA